MKGGDNVLIRVRCGGFSILDILLGLLYEYFKENSNKVNIKIHVCHYKM